MNDLPKAYTPRKYEDEIYQLWEKSGYFNPDNLNLDKEAPIYSIVMPPPNVTGTLHLGHAAMLALEDILIRFYRMKGYRTLWIPGTDHAAIATQTKVEKILKEKGITRYQLGREKFLREVNNFAQKSHNTIVGQIKKMGSSCDWSREAYTLDEVRTKAVRSVFKLMYEDGLIYRGERIVNWCPRCHSTLADDEVEYQEQKAQLYTFRYSTDFPFAIATTRPETKLGDTAIAVNPKDKRYKKYIGRIFEVNFLGQKLKLKVIADRAVDMDFGTGALGVTPAHSLVDWQMAEKEKLGIIKVINEDGKIKSGFGKFSGLNVKEARQKIVDELRQKELLEKEEEISNKISLCYRCGNVIEPLPSQQWFINVNKKIPGVGKSIKELSIEAVEKGVFGRSPIKIYPEHFRKNYFHWMKNLRDWCISRQIWYGHRIPVWRNKKTGEIKVSIENINDSEWKQDSDTLDTWFSSGLWTFSTLAQSPSQIKIKDGRLIIDSDDFRYFHPMNVLETAYDILFFWVARMIIMTTYVIRDIPFYDVYLHGLILDEKGKKMSKSKGNVIDPLSVAEKYGTDAVRLSLVIGSAPGGDMKLSEEKIAGFRNLVNKLWNIARFVIQKLEFNSTEKDKLKTDLTPADKWILNEMRKLIKTVSKDLTNYRFSQAGEKLREFTWEKFADWYLEVSKFEKTFSKEMILGQILKDLLKLWHPLMPFVTEAIWQFWEGKRTSDLLMVAEWPSQKIYDDLLNNQSEDNFEKIKDIISAIRQARAENKVESGRKIEALIYAGQDYELIKKSENLIKSLRTGIEKLKVQKNGEKINQAIYISLGGIDVYLLGAVDTKKEKKRLKKEISNLGKLIIGIENKLTNQQFVSKAPQEIVQREKKRLKNYNLKLKRLENKLKDLRAN